MYTLGKTVWIVAVIMLAAVPLVGCGNDKWKKKDSFWYEYDPWNKVERSSQDKEAARDRPSKTQPFGACESEDLINFSCE